MRIQQWGGKFRTKAAACGHGGIYRVAYFRGKSTSRKDFHYGGQRKPLLWLKSPPGIAGGSSLWGVQYATGVVRKPTAGKNAQPKS